MSKHVLITGGAGFIGSHLARELLQAGDRVRVLDNLSPQVHGPDPMRPAYLEEDAELIVGDVRDPEAVRKALIGIDAVFHFAALVGVGQSMYEIKRYTDVNNSGTATLLEALIETPPQKLVVASSMSIYGEGLYQRKDGAQAPGEERPLAQLQAGDWEVRDTSGEPLSPLPTPETKTPSLASVYALSKYDQERLCLMVGRAYHIPTVALRFFNAYGPDQALSNPYTGVLAIFAARYLNGRAPVIFEDGRQQRDFVSVHDIARACRLALETPHPGGNVSTVFNIGSGQPYQVAEIAARLARTLGREDLAPEISGKYRAGDIRHCYADISLAQNVLGYTPSVSLEEGLRELAGWLEGQVAQDRVAEAGAELARRGLTV